MRSSGLERPATAAGAPARRASPRRLLLSVATAALVACGGNAWQRPRSASDPAEPTAPEASPLPPPTTLTTDAPAPQTPPSAPAHHHHHEAGGAAAQPADATPAAAAYVCPMHPEIVRAAPGKCPICGMELIPRAAAEGGEGR